MSHHRAGAGESVTVSAPVVTGSGLPGPVLLRCAHLAGGVRFVRFPFPPPGESCKSRCANPILRAAQA